jgi:CcmD family protein
MSSQQANPAGTSPTSDPSDRATTFQPVEGGNEQHSGSVLMVEAYAMIWTILMVWLVTMWRKQAKLNERLDGLEGAIAKASSRSTQPLVEPGAAAVAKEAAARKLGGQTS